MEDDFIADEIINSHKKKKRETLLECHICKKKFKFHPLLKNHFKNKHPEEKPYKCDHCDYESTNLSNYHVHKKTRHPSEGYIRKHICSYCNKSFVYKSGLKSHEVIHSSIKYFKCPICLASYHANRELKAHINKLHTEKFSPCLFCSQVSNTLHNLQQHYKEMHPLENTICEHCGKKFANKFDTNKHMLVCKSNKNNKEEDSSSHKENPNHEATDPNKKDPPPYPTAFNQSFPPSLYTQTQGANDPNKKDPPPYPTAFNQSFPPSLYTQRQEEAICEKIRNTLFPPSGEEYDLKNSIELDNFLNEIAQMERLKLLKSQA